MPRYRLTHSAQADIVSILAWSHARFGEEASKRYQTLIATAIRDAAERYDEVGFRPAPSWGMESSAGIWRKAEHVHRVEPFTARATS